MGALSRPWTKFYPKYLPSNIDYPKIPLSDLLEISSSKFPDHVALEFEGKKITYRQLNSLANQFANGLLSMGLGKGSKIGIILPNLPQFVLCFYGALKAGAMAVPCNPLYKEKELELQINDSEADAVVILDDQYGDVDFFSEFEKTRPKLAHLKYVFATSITDFLPSPKKQLAKLTGRIKPIVRKNTISLFEFLSEQPTSTPHSIEIEPINDIAVIQYTGGTTGFSKGAMLTHYNLITNAICSSMWTGLNNEKETVLAVIPYFHIYGLTNAMNAPISAGQRIILMPQFRIKEVLEALHRFKVSIFPGVATMYIALLNFPDIGKYSIRTVKRCVSGAASLPTEVQRRFNEVTGGNLVEGYGLTEASPVTHCNPFGENAVAKTGSIGIPFPDTDAKIVDMESGTKDLPVGEVGEIAVRGPQVMKGYWKMKDETEKVLRNGWLLTGDIGKMDEDGYFYIVDRKKDMINASGFKVWPKEVEEVLYTHPSVKEAAVIGVKDSYRGETVKAFIVLKDKNKNPGADVLQNYCKSKIAAYKVPKLIEFRDDLPKSLVGKTLRRKLRAESES